MKIATIIVHKNLSNEDRIKAIENGVPLEVIVVDDYSHTRNKMVEFDMVTDYLQKQDIKSVDALIAVNNIAAYELNKDSTLVKIIRENNSFTLKALQIPNPYDASTEIENHTVIFSFKTLNTDITNPLKFDILNIETAIDADINEAVMTKLAEKDITITGTTWKAFALQGNCILNIEALNEATSFYGNDKNGFLIA